MTLRTACVGLAALCALESLTGCTAAVGASDEEIGLAESPVYAIPSAISFTQNNWQVPVCFKTPGFASFKSRIQTAIENTWYAHTWLGISGYTDCLGTAPANAVTIEIHENTTPGATGCSGTTNPGMGSRFVGSDSQISITAATNNGCIELVAAHEMGHALGLDHEHQRPDRDANAEACATLLAQTIPGAQVSIINGGLFETTYDPDSVMNYCRDFNRNGTIDLLEVGQPKPYFMSKLDMSGARLMYGFWESDEAISAGFALTQSSSFSGTVNLTDAHSWNSFGAVANQVTRTGTGVYRVDFPRLAGAGPHIQVSSFNSANRCKVDSWANSGSTLQVTVRCHNASGSAANTRFSTSVVHGLGSFAAGNGYSTWKYGGYVLADQPTTAAYDVNATNGYNAAQLTNRIQRTGTGAYTVTFPGLDLTDSPFSYELSAVGSGNEYCNIRGHSDDVTETDRFVDVRCYGANGTPADSKFFLKYAMSTHQTPSFATVYASQRSTPQYTADFTRSLIDNVCGQGPLADPVTITRLGTGRYQVSLPRQLITEQLDRPRGKSMANAVVLPAPAGEYCNVDAFTASPPSVTVRCRRNDGNPIDAAFYLTFASLNASNCSTD